MTFKNFLTIVFALAASTTVSAQWAHIYTTTGDGSTALRTSSVEGTTVRPSDPLTLTTDNRQEIHGFGYALTYSTCYNLLRMPQEARQKLLTKTYSPSEGYGVSYARISLGCSDFSSTEYSYCETLSEPDALADFALFTDETDYVIPVLKEILAINPSLKIIASPWTAPRWMKVDCDNKSQQHYSWKSGSLNPQYYTTYGEYFVKFIQAMKSKGINIHAVTPQNEPLNKNNNASMYMTWEEEADFVKNGLVPALKRAGLNTKIYLFDHNYNYDNITSQEDYPIKAYQRMGTDFDGSDLVVGSAYHNYGGNVSELADIAAKAPDKEIIFSEASIGEWNDGRNLQVRLCEDFDDLIISTSLYGSSASLVWNFMLDDNKGPHMSNGACTTCYGAIDVNGGTYLPRRYNSHYFIIAHAAAGVKPGAHRIDTKGWWTTNCSYAAFSNPDGTTSLLLSNKNSNTINPIIESNGYYYQLNIPANSIITAIFGCTSQAADEDLYTDNSYSDVTPELPAGPDGRKFYVCGIFQGWDPATAPQMGWNESTKCYEVTLTRLSSQFKLINARAWMQGEWGAVSLANKLVPGQPYQLTDDNGKDITFWLDEITDATLSFNPATNQLTVSGTNGKYPALALTGDFTEPEWKLEENYTPHFSIDHQSGIYTIDEYEFPSTPYEFKVVSTSDWVPQWGSSKVISETNRYAVLDCKLNQEENDPANTKSTLSGKYRVTFNINSAHLSFDSKETTLVDNNVPDSESCVTYYNLQGMPVDTPLSGNIYIRHTPASTTKVRF